MIIEALTLLFVDDPQSNEYRLAYEHPPHRTLTLLSLMIFEVTILCCVSCLWTARRPGDQARVGVLSLGNTFDEGFNALGIIKFKFIISQDLV